jgi:hypothetical protein
LKSNRKLSIAAAVIGAAMMIVALLARVSADEVDGDVVLLQVDPEVTLQVQHDVSQPLSVIARAAKRSANHQAALHHLSITQPDGEGDLALQLEPGPKLAITNGLNFDGLGNGKFGFNVDAAPPDANGAVGETQFVEWVNSSFAVFDKSTGALVSGPAAGNSLWSGFGGGCETNNDGAPIVEYDKAANRWVMSQFSISSKPHLQCVAVSTTSDATGSWYRYSFLLGDAFPDYPKLAVWSDGYYLSWNQFSATGFTGAKVCALDRDSMLSGSDALSECFQTSASFGGLLPSDLDGNNPPPSGSPAYYLNIAGGALNLWKFHSDFTAPHNATFIGPTSVSVASYVPACNGGACIPQPGTSQQLDALGDRLMYRLAYRNFGDHESIVANHAVSLGSKKNAHVGVRWYEVRDPGGEPSLYQQGTFAPDSASRWMGSIATDKIGDIALGYSVSSQQIHPSIRFTGRAAGDSLGTMGSEATVIAGSGSQNQGLKRWGDYTSIAIDPVDDCTFWYTNEYLPADGSYNWRTRIASFKFSACQ